VCHFIPGKSRLVEIATWTNQMIYTLINLINETSVKKYFQMYRFFFIFQPGLGCKYKRLKRQFTSSEGFCRCVDADEDQVGFLNRLRDGR
jgi:hypothetical protein